MKKILGSLLSSIYRTAVVVSQASYRVVPLSIRKVPACVISIGNITWGGTGKTPLVARLALELSATGKKVVVLTRGYGKDEVAELKKKLPNVPILVGRDRIKTAQEAVRKFHAEIIILDDGFQHIRLHRDLDIVAINATDPFGPGGLIPLGTLREPLEHLSRARIFVLTKSNIGSKNMHWIRQRLLSIKPDAVIFEAVHEPVQFMDFRRNRFVPLREIKGKKIGVISAIGDPYSFEKTLENLGAEISFAARFQDHHCTSQSEFSDFLRRCKEVGVKDIVTTEKDFYRMEPFFKGKGPRDILQFNFLVLQIEFQVNDEEDFIRRCLNP